MVKYSFVGKTDQGLKRKKNEDAVLVNEKDGFGLVADGIGGFLELETWPAACLRIQPGKCLPRQAA